MCLGGDGYAAMAWRTGRGQEIGFVSQMSIDVDVGFVSQMSILGSFRDGDYRRDGRGWLVVWAAGDRGWRSRDSVYPKRPMSRKTLPACNRTLLSPQLLAEYAESVANRVSG